jgi:hypothetical protein
MIVYLNEQHKLLPQQVAAIGPHTIRPVPAAGWTLAEMKEEMNAAACHEEVCFASPIPALLGWLAAYAAEVNAGGESSFAVYVLHNDNRVAKEITKPDGTTQVIHTIAPEGWELVHIA